MTEFSGFAIGCEPCRRRLQLKTDRLFELLVFPQGLAVRTIDARVDGGGSRATPVIQHQYKGEKRQWASLYKLGRLKAMKCSAD